MLRDSLADFQLIPQTDFKQLPGFFVDRLPIKNIDKICALEEEGGYSETGDWEGAYNRGASYSNRGKHYVRGHYSRGGYPGNGHMGDYSRHNARSTMMERAQDLMGSATTEREREAIRRFMAGLGQG